MTAPLCAPGEHPPSENLAFKQARLKAVSHGSLMDASYEGKPMCVDPHDR